MNGMSRRSRRRSTSCERAFRIGSCSLLIEVAKDLGSKPATATLLSWPIAFLLVHALGPQGSTAHAETTPGGTVTMLPAPDSFQARHQIGAQVGGTGIFQAVYRFRAFGPLHLEAGGFGAAHGGNFSAGLLVGVPVAKRWFPYVGFGGGMMWIFGPKPADGCDTKTTMCPTVTDSDSLGFLYTRVGLGVAFGNPRRHLLSVDVGGWRGSHDAHRSDPAGVDMKTTTAVSMPMAGLSYFYAF